MKLLVTGGAGFIGSHVVERLVTGGHEVRVLDDLSTGKLANLKAVGDAPTFIEGEVADLATVERAVAGCEGVVHLAAVASVEASVLRPLETNRSNLVGTLTVLEAAARAGARRVVYASSAAVYGDAARLPIDEDAEKRPLSPYAADKLAGEHYLAHYHRQGRLDGAAFRFFNVYGPRQDPSSPYSGVISVFLERVARRQPVTIHGDGSQTRDFVYVEDVAEVLLRSLTEEVRASQAEHRELPVMNLGTGTSTDLLTLLDAVAAACGRKGEVEASHGPRREGDIEHSLADVTRLAERYGWTPDTPLRAGLAATASAMTSLAPQ